MSRTTTCETCDNVHMDTRNKHPARWMCVKYPMVNANWWEDEPYNLCRYINRGSYCPLWTERRKSTGAL